MRHKDPANGLSAVKAADEIKGGRLSSVDLVKACLERITQTDETLKAWAFIDPENALAQAAEMDRIRQSGRAVGALHGVPVGIKDIVDTRDMPTARGTPIFEGRQPEADAAIVDRLREAGAVIMGKTATTEFAFVHAAETRNPHNPERTPGGSSSGSVAAVAAFHVPLAIGTQTNGSVIRPASFCGLYGFKPTRGMISRHGILQTSKSLDQVGGFARTLEDVALLNDVMSGYDPRDPSSFARPRPAMREGALADAPVEPTFAWFDMPYHDRLDPDCQEAMDAVLETLGPRRVERIQPVPALVNLVAVQATIHQYEICQHLDTVFAANWDQISATLKPVIESGRKITAAQYEDAIGVMTSAEEYFTAFFVDFDGVIAPSATGEAPMFGPATGDPVFCSMWTLVGLPTVTLPLLAGATGLPIGVQIIGPAERDDRLLRTAGWFENMLKTEL
jgi:Asp-tRNA(Asn)/Glu-tRNA(Gln) amidotransferase A subunit family amidase